METRKKKINTINVLEHNPLETVRLMIINLKKEGKFKRKSIKVV